MTYYQYRKSHCGDKTILRPSYLHNGISYTGKTTSLYWIGAQGPIWPPKGILLSDRANGKVAMGRYVLQLTAAIDLVHKSHNAIVAYPRMQHFVTEMCTCVHISVTKWCILGYFSEAFWDWWNESITLGQLRGLPCSLSIQVLWCWPNMTKHE